MNTRVFAESVQQYLRQSGYPQKELAKELHLHYKVLSRKLNGTGNATLTHTEVQHIIVTFINWHIITTRDELLRLLEAIEVGESFFPAEDWKRPPLSTLTVNLARSTASPGSDHPATSPRRHNLPAPATRLIGREWAVTRLQKLLGRDDVRLVTLVGSGGSGKTRLALHIGRELVDIFEHGVWFVSLAGVNDPALVPMSIIQALQIKSTPGLSALESLTTYLQNRHLLLVLDNFEQVGEATTIISEILAAVQRLKVLVTSRVVLRLYGEHEFSVPPLDIPDPAIALGPAELSHYEAVQLFLERAQAVMPNFLLTAENASVIAQICARVDGLPLALELAAARVKVLPPAQLLTRLLKERLPLLTGGARNLPSRQQTLHNTITWSYALLSPAGQIWFRHLSVFSGGFSLDAAEAMMSDIAAEQESFPDAGSALDMLEHLVDNSLLIQTESEQGEIRFTMLETLREYAWEQLTAKRELERLRDWHACYYLQEAEAGELGLRGPQQRLWLSRLTTDRDNFRAAMEWLQQRARARKGVYTFSFFAQESGQESMTVAGSRILSTKGIPHTERCSLELYLRLAAALRAYFEWQGDLTEARYWLEAALEVPMEDRVEKTICAAHAKALSEAARLACLRNDQHRSVELAEESIAGWRPLNDASGLATALLHRSWPALILRDYETAKQVCEEGLSYLSTPEDSWLRAQLFFYRGTAAGFNSDYDEMRSFYRQSRELFEQVGDKSAVADVLKDQGGMSLLEGRYKEAIDCLVQSMQLSYQLDHKQYMASGMWLLSYAFGLMEEPDPVQTSLNAAQIEGAAQSLMETIGFASWTDSFPPAQMVRQQIRLRLGEQRYEAARAAGRELTTKEAVDLILRLARSLDISL